MAKALRRFGIAVAISTAALATPFASRNLFAQASEGRSSSERQVRTASNSSERDLQSDSSAQETVTSPTDAPSAAETKPPATIDRPEANPATIPTVVTEAVDPVANLQDQAISLLRQMKTVCGVVFGEIDDSQLNVTVVVEAAAAEPPSPEELATKIRPLCGDREIKVVTAPWPAAERLGQLQEALKSHQELADVKLEGIFLQGRTPQSLECRLRGSAKDPDSPNKLIAAIAPLVKEFDTPFESALIPVASDLVVPLPDPEPLLLAIQKSIAQSPEFNGLRVERIVPTVADGKKWQLLGDSPVPLVDAVNLTNLWNRQLSLVYPQWATNDGLKLETPTLRQRLPEVAPVLAAVQKRLAAEKEWVGCELSGITVSSALSVNGDASSTPDVIWKLEGGAADPDQERRLEQLCQDVNLEVHPWWERTRLKQEDPTETAQFQLQVQSWCELRFPSPKALEQQLQALVKSAPEWRGCRVDRIEEREDHGAAGGASSPDHAGARSMSWLLIGEVNSPGQERRLVALAAEELCRMFPKWNGSARLRIDPEPQLELSPVDPAPLLPVMQTKLSKCAGWGGCSVTAIERVPCAMDAKPTDAFTSTKWQIVGTVAFLTQQRRLPALALEAFDEVYPAWDKADRPEIDPNQSQVKVEHPNSAALLASLLHDLERMPDYDDCQIVGATIESAGGESMDPMPNESPAGGRVEMNLFGRTSRATRRESFVSLHQFPSLTALYGPDATSESSAELVADPTDLDVVPSSSGLASLQFEMGQGHFVRHQFGKAKAAFSAAMFEEPDNLNYKMWHIAMCLALCDDSLAHDRLLNLLRSRRAGYRNSYEFRLAMKSLERLQGPLRNRLANLERQVMSEIDSNGTRAP